ncbi:MAG: 2-phospho-L-lactate guanylyltransferase [Ktedonobacterales bacterium]|nr:2-phospho-L-lactate guanylyltransferase [Ktedonobacterales bacterium]
MRTVAVIPLRGLADCKQLLSKFLPDRVRRALILALAGHVADAVCDSGAVAATVIVSPETEILRWAEARGLTALRQTNTGLNAGLWQATNWARERHFDALLALHADLPLLTPDHISALVRMLGASPTAVVAGDRHAHGTTGLALQPLGAIPFHFGDQSYTRHLIAGEAHHLRTIPYQSREVGFDLDTPRDLRDLLLWHPVGFARLTRAVVAWLPQLPETAPLAAPTATYPAGEGQR